MAGEIVITSEQYLERESRINAYLNDHINQVSGRFSIAKANEECNELATVLAQMITKPHKHLRDDLIGEIADVELSLAILKKTLDIHDVEILLKKEEKIEKIKQLKIKYAPNFGQL